MISVCSRTPAPTRDGCRCGVTRMTQLHRDNQVQSVSICVIREQLDRPETCNKWPMREVQFTLPSPTSTIFRWLIRGALRMKSAWSRIIA